MFPAFEGKISPENSHKVCIKKARVCDTPSVKFKLSKMKLTSILCLTLLGVASAHNRITGKQVLAEFDHLVKSFEADLKHKYNGSIEGFQGSLNGYIKSYNGIQTQLNSILEEVSLETKFAVFNVYAYGNGFVQTAQAETNLYRTRIDSIVLRPFNFAVAASRFRVEAIAEAVDRNPKYYKCWRKYQAGLNDYLSVMSSSAVGENIVKRMGNNLHSLSHEVVEFVAKIDHDLCKCDGPHRSACVDRYVSLHPAF